MRIYAAGDDVPPSATVEHTGTNIHVASIDLRRPIKDLIRDLAQLADAIRQLALLRPGS